eukprot:scaffold1046_cov172-Amphora_coffeaeformis.AAC.9
MKSFPSVWVQHILFLVPYTFTFLTCVTLLVVDVDGGTDTLRASGFCNSLIFVLYLTGWLGPHYLKLCCGFFNCAVAALLGIQNHFLSATVVLGVYCIPAFLFVVQAIWVPSITGIIPGVYLCNRSAAFSSKWLDRFHITHILDMTASTQSRPAHIRVKTVYVKDFLGSHGSLDGVLPECMSFVEQTMAQPGANLLIHCSAGQSRSAAFLLYYLMVHQGTGLNEGYAFIRRKRPVVDISSDHMAPLRALDTTKNPRKDQ